MGIISIILLVGKIIVKLPTFITIGIDIIKLIRGMKGGSLADELALVVEILKLIASLTGVNTAAAGEALVELHQFLSQPFLMASSGENGLEGLKSRLENKLNPPNMGPSEPIQD